MKQLTFRTQMYISLGILVVSFILSTATRCGIFTNIGWGLYGLGFLIHPVWPKSADHADPAKMRRAMRIAGAVVLVLACITRFGV